MAMGRLNPCYICGASLRAGVLFLSILYMFASLGLVLFCVREYTMNAQYDARRKPNAKSQASQENHTSFDDDSANLYKYVAILALINIVFYLLLWHGAIKNSRNRCLIWFSISTVETSVLLARILFYDVHYYKLEVGMFLFNLYSLWVVWEYTRQLLLEDRDMTLPSTLSDSSIDSASSIAMEQEVGKSKNGEKDLKPSASMSIKKQMDDEIPPHHEDHPYYGKPMVTPLNTYTRT